MNNASFFIKNRALFGSFPTQDAVEELEQNGVKYFINLTDITKEKNIIPYTTKYVHINYPILDNYIPTNLSRFSSFIIKISNIIKSLKRGELVYIHCRAGHSRSAIVVACIICYIFKLSSIDSLQYTTKCHSNRINLRERRRKLGAPQSLIQKKFVHHFFENLILKDNKFSNGFLNNSLFSVKTELGIFPTSQLAFNKHINEYMIKNNFFENDVENIKNEIMTKILKLKFEQNIKIKENLLNTGLKNLIYQNKNDYFWSDDNKLGKIIMQIRNEYYHNI